MRIVTIILSELNSDKLKQEHHLEQLVNSNGNVDDVVREIKKCLRKITNINNMIQTWLTYTQETKKNETDGKI